MHSLCDGPTLTSDSPVPLEAPLVKVKNPPAVFLPVALMSPGDHRAESLPTDLPLLNKGGNCFMSCQNGVEDCCGWLWLVGGN